MQENTAFKIFTNTAGQIILRGFDIVFGVITLGLITRYLGQEGFGYYTTVFAFLQLFIIIIDFGLYLTLLREISSQPKERISFITSNIFTLRLLSSLMVKEGSSSRIKATSPLTCGAAIDVPLIDPYVSLGNVLRMLDPGAPKSTVVNPQFERPDNKSL